MWHAIMQVIITHSAGIVMNDDEFFDALESGLDQLDRETDHRIEVELNVGLCVMHTFC